MGSDRWVVIWRERSCCRACLSQRVAKEIVVGQTFATPHKQIAGKHPCLCVWEATIPFTVPNGLHLLDGMSCFFIQRHEPLAFHLARGNVQARRSVRIRIKARQRQACNLIATSSTPTSDQQRGSLKRTREFANHPHQTTHLALTT